MSDEGGSLAMLIILVAAVVSAGLFSDQYVRPAQIDWAVSSCAANGGIDRLWADFDSLRAECANGAVFVAEKHEIKERAE